jgi:predicted patatin/cPLA2 family phospholipase
VFKKQEPLDIEKVQASPVHWCIPLSDFDTGRTFYTCAKDNLDPFEILRAAKAIPYLFGKRVPLAHGRYIDGELGPILQDHLDHALSLGARTIVIINHTAPWTLKRSLPMRLYSTLIARGMHDAVSRDISTDVTAYHASDARILFISPSNLPCGSATHSKEKIKATFERGVEDALALRDELQELFQV